MYWATRVSGIGFEMAVPTVLGYWLDTRWGTTPWLVVTGACLGFIAAMLDFVSLARGQSRRGNRPPGSNSPTSSS